MYKSIKHHHGCGIKNFISLWIYIRYGPTKVRKAGLRILVPCRAPYLHPGEGRGMTVKFCSVMYLRVPSVQDLCSELLQEI